MFIRDGYCEFCRDEKFATVLINANNTEKEICVHCLVSEYEKEYDKEFDDES